MLQDLKANFPANYTNLAQLVIFSFFLKLLNPISCRHSDQRLAAGGGATMTRKFGAVTGGDLTNYV